MKTRRVSNLLFFAWSCVVALPAAGAPDETISEHYAALSWLHYVAPDFWTKRQYRKIAFQRELSSPEFALVAKPLTNTEVIGTEELPELIQTGHKTKCVIVRAVVPAMNASLIEVLTDGSRWVVRDSFLHAGIVALRRTAVLVCEENTPTEVYVALNAAQ